MLLKYITEIFPACKNKSLSLFGDQPKNLLSEKTAEPQFFNRGQMKSKKNSFLSIESFVILIFSLSIILSALYLEKANYDSLIHEINISRGLHPGALGVSLFNKANYLTIVFFKFIDKLWPSNIINLFSGIK